MAGRGTNEPHAQQEEVAAYVASLARELKVLVERHDLAALAYLLDLVRLEAEERANGKSNRFA
jgi:hypothetical protein